MSPVHQAPGADQKLTPNPSKTQKQEGAGAIDPSSLAAESTRSGGAFADNRGADPGSGATADPRAAAPGSRSSNTASKHGNLESQESYGGAAPSYVNAASSSGREDAKKPRGANLTEGGFAGSGTAGGALPEPGSKRDPARDQWAERGPVKGAGMEDEQPFRALGRDEEA